MKHSQNSIDEMTADEIVDEIVDAIHNGTIESLQAKDILRIIYEIESKEDVVLDYDRGYNEGQQVGREEALSEAIAALESL